jgi:hypothetical protein
MIKSQEIEKGRLMCRMQVLGMIKSTFTLAQHTISEYLMSQQPLTMLQRMSTCFSFWELFEASTHVSLPS